MSHRISCRCVIFSSLVLVSASAAADFAPFEFDPTQVNSGAQLTPVEVPARFGVEGSTRWQLLAGYANDFDAAQQGTFGASVSWFAIDDFSIDMQLDGNYFSQAGGPAWGLEGALLFRWHFYSTATWSLYADAGSGMLLTTEPTPTGGTSFNFTPQAGGGVSFDIATDVRLMLGVRWYHISNANTGETNPGRNSLMGYAMVSIPF